jgi:ComF family protein
MELAQKILSSLFPSRCILCRKTVDRQQINPDIEICIKCESKLPINTRYCQRCALPLPDDLAGDNFSTNICGCCIKKSPAFDYSYSLFRYETESITLVHQLKFGGKISYARSISELLSEKLQLEVNKTSNKPDCLLPVPLHNSRLRQRGFNQSIEICHVIAKKLNIPIECKAMIRVKQTTAQTGLDAKQRQKNIKGAFELSGKINYKHILIVDDVVTTGSTVNELAILLKKNGVQQVGVLSIARAPLKN